MVYQDTQEVLLRIRQQMLADKITIKELSERMNKSQSGTSQIFRQTNISLESLNDICKALDLNLIIDIERKDDNK